MVSDGTTFDAFVAERRIRALWEPPWVLPATVVIGMTDEDLDLLYVARDKDEYHREQAERHWVLERHQEDRCYHEPPLATTRRRLIFGFQGSRQAQKARAEDLGGPPRR
jgi:hypothetical protein